ncbi:MAG: TetR/AcrR family transcriptional regulator [Firmicutes bacterium]|jgi:AcrR family transcriptional regulator|nr:TetR/AcrR family transcriptional regulator [Bacillota bacterium]
MQIKKDEVKNKIIDSATKLFLDKGYKNTSMKDIAIEAGLSTSNIYTYVKSKNKLFKDIVIDGYNAYYNFIESISTDRVWQDSNSWTIERETYIFKRYVNMIYLYKDQLKILFFKAQDSEFEDFLEDVFTKQYTRSFEVNTQAVGGLYNFLEKELPVYIVKNSTRMYLNIMLEGLKEDIGKDEMVSRLSECVKFLFGGYNSYFTEEIKIKE